MFVIFWYFIKFTKISLFHWKLWRNLQYLEGCKISLRFHNGTCNTAFESLNVIPLNMIIFGYHSGTQNTRNSENVRHLKWGRLERGHLQFCGISQQVLTITIIIKRSALPSSFWKYLTPRSRIPNHLFANSRLLKLTLYVWPENLVEKTAHILTFRHW